MKDMTARLNDPMPRDPCGSGARVGNAAALPCSLVLAGPSKTGNESGLTPPHYPAVIYQ